MEVTVQEQKDDQSTNVLMLMKKIVDILGHLQIQPL